ncbi:hypothetical protein ACETU7_25145 [Rhodococcus sp. 3Y1]
MRRRGGGLGGDLPLGKEEAELGRNVLLVQQPGAGTNFIDAEAWRAAGVPVANTPGANANSVAGGQCSRQVCCAAPCSGRTTRLPMVDGHGNPS